MALNKAGLKNGIKALMTDMRTRTEVSDDDYAAELANLIEAYVKSATIVYTSGLVAPQGPVTGVFNGNLE